QVLYRDSVRAWLADQSDVAAAERVVRFGNAIRPTLADRLAAKASVLQTVAQAADLLAESDSSDRWLRTAVEVRSELADLGQADDGQLRLLAAGHARLGDASKAAETWLTVLQRAPQNSLGWYEARLESIKQLETVDLEQARNAAEQFRALHPDLGPPSYRSQFETVLARLLGSNGEEPR
ncbi:MAG: hypothetical protein AAFV43_17180, partial [Planctomycetota bacterium]